MAPSEGPDGDPAAEDGPTSVTRSSRSGPTTTRYFGGRPAAAPTAGECDADGVEEEEEGGRVRRGYYPNPAPRRSTPAAAEGGSQWLGKRQEMNGKEAVLPRCGVYRHTFPRRPRPFGEGTSAAGAEAAVLTCGCYADTPPRPFVEGTSAAGAKEAVLTCGCYGYTPRRRPRPFVEGTSAAGAEEAVLTCGCYGYTPRRRPRPFGEGTSAPGAEEAVLTCGCYGYTPRRRLLGANSTALGPNGGVARCIPTLVRPGSDPTPCVQNQMASGGRGGRGCRGQRDSNTYDDTSGPRSSEPHALTADLPAKSRSENDAAFCIPVVAAGRGDGGGRGDRSYTARPHAFMPAPTSDLAPKDKATSETIQSMGEGYLAKIVQADAAKAIKVGEVMCVTLEEEGDMDKFKDYKPLAADLHAAPSVAIPTPEPAEPKVEEKVSAKALEPKALKANILEYTDIPNAQIRKVIANHQLAYKQTIPHYYSPVDTRVDKLIKLPGELNPLQEASGGKKISEDLVIKDEDKKGRGIIGQELKQLAQRARESSLKPQDYEVAGPQPFSDPPDFVCSDRGGCFGKSNYISKMKNYYIRADCISDINPISDREGRTSHSRYEVLKGRCCDLGTMSYLPFHFLMIFCVIFMDICGSTVSLQRDPSKIDINMLSEAAFVRAGIKPSDFYLTYAGKVLEPNRLLSCYRIPRDSTIKLNARLRGGCAARNWDAVIGDLDRYQTVHLAEDDLVLPEQIIDPQVEVRVKYLADILQIQCRKVLIYLCRKHYSGHSFGGNFSSEQIMFDSDGNVHITAAPQDYRQNSALLDYNVVSEIFDRALGQEDDKYPTHFHHLIIFLSVKGPVVDCQSKAVIAFVTNHISLLAYSERIQHSALLDLFIGRLGAGDQTDLIATLDSFDWGARLEMIQAMKEVYYFVWWLEDERVCVPYKKHGVSLLRFSHNFFKHCFRFPLHKLEAAFSLVTADKDFLAHMLFKILVRLKSKCRQPCPPSIEAFVDEVIKMLGDHTVDCMMAQVN
ncbi:Alanyl-tRNA synthetase, mitochondrial [Hordeum vulgare]|nr:Alanyl-tRNA synthetase, mitochondrial [Hordeum vulgare]